jgi:hypothetical protein
MNLFAKISRALPYVVAAAVGISLISTNAVFAQGTTSAAMNGIVTDLNGQPLVGATVVAVHVPSGTRFGTTTRDDGRYNLVGLRVGGPYTVTCSYVGYQKEEETSLTLVLSQNLTIDFKLVEEAVQTTEVLVTAERNAILSSGTTGSAATVRGEDFNRLATISRSFQDFQKIDPLYVDNSAAGVSFRYNNIKIDGAMYNDLFGLPSSGTPGGQAGTNPISLDALQEFQVVIAPYDVRQGVFTGAGVNAVTRSGGNSFTGAAYYYGRNENFVGKSADASQKPYADFSEYQAGFRLGGPISENKMFFFVNGELTKRNQPIHRILGSSVSAPTNNQFTVSPATVQQFIDILRDKYGYTTSLGSFTDIVNERPSTKIFARLDFNLSDQHRLTIRNNYVDGWDDNAPSTSQNYSSNAIYPAENRYKFVSTTNSTALTLSSTFSNAMANELIVSYTRIRDHRDTYGSLFPTVVIRNTGLGADADLEAGTEEFSGFNSLDQDVYEITDNFTYFYRDHTFTIGTSNQLFKFSNLFLSAGYGYYQFANLNDFQNGIPVRYDYKYVLPGGNLYATWKGIQYGVYAQDEWTGIPKLKLTLGLRLDVPTFPDKPRFNASVDTLFGNVASTTGAQTIGPWSGITGLGTDKVPSGRFLVSPRLGFNWDPVGDRSWQLRGGLGVFSGRIGYVWLSNQYSNTGVDIGAISSTSLPASFRFVPDANQQPTTVAGVKTAEIDLTDKDFKMPQVFRTDIALDHQLPFGLVGTVEGVYTKTLNDIYYQNINMAGPQTNGGLTPGGYLAGDGRPVFGTYSTSSRRFTTVNFSDRLAASVQRFTYVYLMTNTDEGYQYYLTLQLVKPVSPDGWAGNLSYTYGMAKDVNSVLSSTASSQWGYNLVPGDPNHPPLAYSNYDQRHRIFAAVSRRFEFAKGWGTTIGLAYEGRSGLPFSIVYNGDVNGDAKTSNDLIYIPKDRNDIILMSSTSASATVLPTTDPAYDRLEQFISGMDYLKDHRGQIEERNGLHTPWNHYFDVNLVQEIPTFQGHKVEIVVSILNFLNLLKHSWGNIYSVTNQSYTNVLSFQSLDPTTGRPRYALASTVGPGFTPWSISDLASRWQMQLGARYEF